MMIRERPVEGREWQWNLISPGVLTLLWVLFFDQALFSSKIFYFRDTLSFHYPLRRVLIDSYGRWEFPLWNPFIYFGQPMLANPNYLAFYPTNLFHLFFPFDYAFKLHLLIHPLLGGMGVYCLQRRLGISGLAALGGAVIYEFSGTVLSFLNLYSIMPAVAVLPWMGWAFCGVLYNKGRTPVLLFGAIFGLQLLFFEPFLLQCNLWLLAGLAVMSVHDSRNRLGALRRVLLAFCVGAILGLSLAAVQIVPGVELLSHSIRGTGDDISVLDTRPMHPVECLNLVVPNLFGNLYTMNHSEYWGEFYQGMSTPYFVSYFIGPVAILLACVSFLSDRKSLRWTFQLLAVISMLLSFGDHNPAYSWLRENFYLFRLGRYPVKFFLLGTMAISILASLGLEAVLRAAGKKTLQIAVFGLCGLIVGCIVLAACVYWHMNANVLEDWIRSLAGAGMARLKDFPGITWNLIRSLAVCGAFFFIGGLALVVAKIWRPGSGLGVVINLLLIGELLLSNQGLYPLISREDIQSVSVVDEFVSARTSAAGDRVVSMDSLTSFLPAVQADSRNGHWEWYSYVVRASGQPMYGIVRRIPYSLDQPVDYLNTRESEQLSRYFLRAGEERGMKLLRNLGSPIVLSRIPIADSSIDYVATFDTRSDTKLHLLQLKNALRRAYFVSGVDVAASQDDALRQFVSRKFSPGDTVILESPAMGKSVTGSGKVRILSYQNNAVVCEVEAETSGYLVLLDSYYPGWRATVNGRDADLLRANYAFRAVEVEPGKHEVKFVYRPTSFYLGAAITLIVSITVLLLWRWKIRPAMG